MTFFFIHQKEHLGQLILIQLMRARNKKNNWKQAKEMRSRCQLNLDLKKTHRDLI